MTEPIYVEYVDGTKVLIGYRNADETVEQWAQRQGQQLDEQFDEIKAWLKFKGLECCSECGRTDGHDRDCSRNPGDPLPFIQ